jgi:hypothetical protein
MEDQGTYQGGPADEDETGGDRERQQHRRPAARVYEGSLSGRDAARYVSGRDAAGLGLPGSLGWRRPRLHGEGSECVPH